MRKDILQRVYRIPANSNVTTIIRTLLCNSMHQLYDCLVESITPIWNKQQIMMTKKSTLADIANHHKQIIIELWKGDVAAILLKMTDLWLSFSFLILGPWWQSNSSGKKPQAIHLHFWHLTLWKRSQLWKTQTSSLLS